MTDQLPSDSRTTGTPNTSRTTGARTAALAGQFAKFGIVGATGVVVNQVAMILSQKFSLWAWDISPLDPVVNLLGSQFHMRWYHVFSIIAFVVANIWNFVWNRRFTFTKVQQKSWFRQLVQFMAAGVLGLIVTLLVSTALVNPESPLALPREVFDGSSGLRTPTYWGNLIGVCVAMPTNFIINKLWTFRNRPPATPGQQRLEQGLAAQVPHTGASMLAAAANSEVTVAQGKLSPIVAAALESSLIKFILVGGFSAVVDLGTTLLARALGASDGLAKALGFVLGTLTAYLINRRWTFRAEPSMRRFLITMATYGATFLVQWSLYMVSIPWLESLGLGDLAVRVVSFVIAQGVATVLNFLIQRFVIFR